MSRASGRENLRIVLGSGYEGFGSIRGVVRDAITRAPIARARVAARPPNGEGWIGAATRSGTDGSYALAGCPSESLDLYVDAAGYAIFESQVPPGSPDRRNIDVELLPARTLRLLIVGADRAPRAQVSISAIDERKRATSFRDAYGHDAGQEARTDASGRAALHGLPATRVRLQLGHARDPREDFTADTSLLGGGNDEAETTEIDLSMPVHGIRRVVIGP